MYSYSAYCSVGILTVVAGHTARTTKLPSLQGFSFWFDLTSKGIQYLSVRTTILSALTFVHVESTVHGASQSLTFRVSESFICGLHFFGHPSSHLFELPLLDLRV